MDNGITRGAKNVQFPNVGLSLYAFKGCFQEENFIQVIVCHVLFNSLESMWEFCKNCQETPGRICNNSILFYIVVLGICMCLF